jgi:predicted O-methyltransferase YrrM
MTGREFTSNWFKGNEQRWLLALRPFKGRALDYLEVGSHEGRSAIFIAEQFPDAKITCVDLWQPSDESALVGQEAKQRFDRNIEAFRSRLRSFEGRSGIVLETLRAQDESFDVIYIDGAHDRASVFVDSALAWQLLRVGGVLIWDDYLWKRRSGGDSRDRPQEAIDTFLQAFSTAYSEIEKSTRQVIVRKSREWPRSRPSLSIPSQFRRLARHLRTHSQRLRDLISGNVDV